MATRGGVIGAQFQLDSAAAAAGYPGLRVLGAVDLRDAGREVVAIATTPGLPPRPMLLAARDAVVPHAVLPLACGPAADAEGKPGWFIIAPAPPGPGLEVAAPWREGELLDGVLRPAATALAAFAQRGWTHRAIRPENLFRARAGQPVTLGPCWAAPPAAGQPAVFEPPWSAACHPVLRGDGTIADDVYAVGVSLLALALGRLPMAGLDAPEVVSRKLAQGSFAALAGDAALPSWLADLLRAMLDDDPAQRPSPERLVRMPQARGFRPGMRTWVRASRPIAVGGQTASSAAGLAHALGAAPGPGAALLRSGEVQRWLRLSLGDPVLHARLDETLRDAGPARGPDESALVLQAALALDPQAPVMWRGAAFWPSGLGAGIAASLHGLLPAELGAALLDAVQQDAMAVWQRARRGPEAETWRRAAREWRAMLMARGLGGGARRLVYALNPLAPCASPLLQGRLAVRADELLAALDLAAPTADRSRPPFDAEIAAFLAARGDPPVQAEVGRMAGAEADDGGVLRIIARLQAGAAAAPLPELGRWLIDAGAGLARWRNRRTRAALRARLETLAASGDLAGMEAALAGGAAPQVDQAGCAAAARRREAITAELRSLAARGTEDADAAQLLGIEIASAAGLAGGALAAAASLLG